MNKLTKKAADIRKREELEDSIENLINIVCEKAEEERERAIICNESDLFCLKDTLDDYNEYVNKAFKCKTIAQVKQLKKRFKGCLPLNDIVRYA